MSRYYELIEMERDQAFRADSTLETALSIPGESRSRMVPPQVACDSTWELVQRVFLQQTQNPPRMVVFAAVDHGSGCSQIAASVAQTLTGKAPEAVCLVEANFRSPALPKMLGSTNYHGLTDALLEQGSVRSFLKPVCNQKVWLLSSGSLAADSPNLLTSERLPKRFAELRREFDFVIVDAPPIKRYGDAIALGKLADGVVVVIEAESTRRQVAHVAVENLRAAGVKVLGAVLNKRTFPIPEGIYKRL